MTFFEGVSGDNKNKEAGRKLAFLSLSTTFFVSHFRPAVRAARLQGFELIAFLPEQPAEGSDDIDDVKVILIGGRRARFPFLRLFPNLYFVVLALWRNRPDVVQAFSLQACVILALASRLIPVGHRIYTITGLGLIDVDRRWLSRLHRPLLYRLFRAVSGGASSTFIFENTGDSRRLGFKEGLPRRALRLMGAGVDPRFFMPERLPARPPLKVAVVSRMIWTKGIDLAIQAASQLVNRGVPVELDLYGDADPHNPQSFPEALLEQWGKLPGVRWRGHQSDIRAIWRDHHVGLFASRGGEGLPRAMLEAAACGRALITTSVPGCSDFVRPGVEGLVVKPNSVDELAWAIESLARQPERLVEMGDAARRRVVETATEELITTQYGRLFAGL
jgi:glycosyltransferase involved in cell wall biosynthesis